jgi:Protein of unknown function (DUF2442)
MGPAIGGETAYEDRTFTVGKMTMTSECATVTGVRVLSDYRLELTFADGVCGTVDLSKRILGRGGVFKALEEPAFFRQVQVNHELGTIVWPNDVDFCPDMLYRWAAGEPVSPPEEENVVT